MRKHFTTIVISLIFLIGLSLVLYPVASDLLNRFNHARVINSYIEEIQKIDPVTYDGILDEARAYNKRLAKKNGTIYLFNDADLAEYESLLNVTGTGIMGYIDIPVVDVYLPIYHGTSEAVLQVGVGHLDGTSLPVGGESVHTVLSGHRGLPSATLFTNIDKLMVGDVFSLNVLNEMFTYEVDQIQTVEPSEVNNLTIEKGKDYCTLLTCTPYGINTHRLLIRGHRIPTPNESNWPILAPGRSEAIFTDSWKILLVAETPVMLLTAVIIILRRRRRMR